MLQLLSVCAKHRTFLWRATLAGVVAGALVASFVPRSYEATARILPPLTRNRAMAASALRALGVWKKHPVFDATGAGAGDVYVDALRSRTVGDTLVDRFSLQSVYAASDRTQARRELERATEISASREGLITVVIRDRDAWRAAALANSYIEQLGTMLQSMAEAEARARASFYRQQVGQARAQLAVAENNLKQVAERTGVVNPDLQAKLALQTYVQLREQIALKEADVRSMQTFAAVENPDLIRTQGELAALRSQLHKLSIGTGSAGLVSLSSFPEAEREFLHAQRESQICELLLQDLQKLLHAAEMDSGKDAIVIGIIDRATPPEQQVGDWMRRGNIALMIAIFVFCGSLIGVFVREARGSQGRNHLDWAEGPERQLRLGMLEARQ